MIAFIAPYLGLKRLVDNVVESQGYPVTCYLGNLNEGLSIAEELESQGRTIFISRGGTAQLLQKNMTSQVIEIRISFLDLLEVFKTFIGTTQKIGVVGFSSLVEPSRAICQSLGINAHYYIVEDENEVFSKIEAIQHDGIEYIVGDVISVRIAEKYKIKFHLIESGLDSVKEVIDKALIIESNIKTELEKLGKILAIFNSVKDGIISIDKDGHIEQYNLKAKEYLTHDKDIPLKNLHINQLIPDNNIVDIINNNTHSYGKIFSINGLNYSFYSSPILIDGIPQGAVTIFQPVKELQKIENKIRKQIYNKGLYAKYSFDSFHVYSKVMHNCISIGKQYSKTLSNILIIGETGTGKELMAQSIHNNSEVKDGPFVALNCGALPAPLMESELFGYVEGAFTGALKGGKTGLIEIAHNGTLFLDEINSLDINLQSKLLRVIQEREIMKIGDNKILPVSVRIISASNSSLSKDILDGKFRKDLYYRLNVLDIHIPSLKQRKEDIFPLFKYFLDKYSKIYFSGKSIQIGTAVETLMIHHDWPGNIRELENWAEKCAVLFSMDSNIKLESYFAHRDEMSSRQGNENFDSYIKGSLKEIEKRIINSVLDEESGNITRAATRLNIDRNTLKRKMSST